MKKILFAALLGVVTLGAVQAQTVKIGYINSMELLSMMPEAKEADAKLQKMAKDLEAQYREYMLEYQRQLSILQSDSTLSEVAREAKIQDLTNLEQRITDFESSSQEKLNTKRSELYEPILDGANKIVQEVAKDNGYTHVFDSSTGAIIYAPEGDDIIELVKTRMGIQ